MKKVNWGIIGCGYIANQFATALLTNTDSKLVAVASASSGLAKEFAEKFHVNKYYNNYRQLLELSEVDIVYIANCTSQHKESILACLKYGKAVLCEKPLTINSRDTEEVIEFAKKRNLFLMEGMWMRFHPAIQKTKELLSNNLIGDVKLIKADFGFKTKDGLQGRHLNPNLAGGALLDVGIYSLSLANFLLNKSPVNLKSSAYIGETGVDEISAYLLTYDKGEIALLSSAVNLSTPHDAEIIGTKGRIRIPDFWHAQKIILHLENRQTEEIFFPYQCNGFEYEIQEVVRCLKENKKESDVMPWEDTLHIMSMMDSFRKEWNLRYSGE